MTFEQAALWVGLGTDQLAVVLSGIAAFISIYAVCNGLIPNDTMTKRAKALRQRQQELAKGLIRPKRDATRQKSAMVMIRSTVRRLKLLQAKTSGHVAEHLSRCGWRSRDAVIIFMAARLVAPLLFAVLGAMLVPLLGVAKGAPLFNVLLPLAGAVLGFYTPTIFVRNTITRREQAIQRSLPDGLDLLVICSEAGLSMDAALTRVSQELARSNPELADEIGIAAVELGFLPERRQALVNLMRRCQLPSVRAVVNTLSQTEKYGTPLANALRVLSAEFRHERLMKAEEKAARLPAMLTVPMIVFILPVLLVVLIGPAALRTVDAFSKM